MTNSGLRQTLERPLLVMIGACLLVILCAIGLLVVDQKTTREEQIRARGIGLARLIASLPYASLDDDQAYRNMLQLVSFSQGSDDFVYAAFVNGAGIVVAEVTTSGVIVPAAPVAGEPANWIGERVLTPVPGERAILEFYAPVFRSGELVGHIRLGYYRPNYQLLYEQLPAAATLALLIFLLTPLLYFLLRREIRPLAEASVKLESMASNGDSCQVMIGATPSLAAFLDRFNRFVDVAQKRIKELEDERSELVASASLLSYSKSRIDMTLQTLPDGVLVIDGHGKINYINERATTMLCVSRQDVLSKSPREWCTNQEVVEFLGRYETSAAARYSTDTLRVRALPEQTNRGALAVNGYPLFSPQDASEIYGTLIVIRDVTREAIEQDNHASFIAHLGHELKTPLNTLSLYSEMLLDLGNKDDAKRIEAVNTIHDEVERLVGLVNNMMSISRLETRSLDAEKQRVRLADLLEDICVSLGKNAKQNNVQVDVSVPRELDAIMADKDLLRIAINNLVSNAIKYNRPGGSVSIAAEDTDEAILIRVSDTGIGMSPEDCGRVFEKFYRSENEEVRQRGGHGLGLALAFEIIVLHGGTITVASEPGVGSTFTISLNKQFGLMKRAI